MSTIHPSVFCTRTSLIRKLSLFSARHFNTSRASKSRNDTSPVDLVYMPQTFTSAASTDPVPRVPILPDAYTHYETASTTPSAMKPQIHSVADDLGSDLQGPSAMTEVVDNQALDINPFNLAETVTQSRNAAESSDAMRGAEEGVGGAVREIWHGLWEDVLGPKQNAPRSMKRA